MKIGVLTHPLGVNYGGILQCYALSIFLKKMGHEPIVIQREQDDSCMLWRMIRNLLRLIHIPRYYKSPSPYDPMKEIAPFVDTHILRTPPIRSQRQMKRVCDKFQLQAVIVGSDQVWRKDFAMNYGYNYFLDFVPKGVKKISYAASFGIDAWDYSPTQTLKIKKLLSQYQGISVREEYAIKLLKEHIGCEAQLMIDPTMLLPINIYDEIASARLVKDKYIFIYWLGDKSLIKSEIEHYKQRNYKIVYIGLREQRTMPSIGDWLSCIKYAELVLTDSFHGCVLSVLYHRPLKVFKNVSGGFNRITSLLNLLDLSANEITSPSINNYPEIDHKLNMLRNNSHNFIENSIQ